MLKQTLMITILCAFIWVKIMIDGNKFMQSEFCWFSNFYITNGCLGSSALNRGLINEDIVLSFPNQNIEAFSGKYMSNEPNLSLLKKCFIIVQNFLTHNSANCSISSQTMNNGFLEFLGFCHLRVNMKRIPVMRQPIDKGLTWECMSHQPVIRISLRDFHWRFDKSFSLEVKPSKSFEEKSGIAEES